MPFRSAAQRRYLHANLPEVAKEYEAETSPLDALPERVRRTKTHAVSKATKRTRGAVRNARKR